MRRIPIILLVVFAFVGLTVSAEDFWISKDWKQWSAKDCEKMLTDSPWSLRKGALTVIPDPSSRTDGYKSDMLWTQNTYYMVQLFSAQPIREAIVRQQQIAQQYDKLNASQKQEIDSRAELFISHSYDDVIVFRIDYTHVPYPPKDFPDDIREDASNYGGCFLITEKGEQIRPIRFVRLKGGQKVRLVFPAHRERPAGNQGERSRVHTGIPSSDCRRPGYLSEILVFYNRDEVAWKSNLLIGKFARPCCSRFNLVAGTSMVQTNTA